MSNWDKLSIRERAELMHMYVNGGIIDIDEMKEHYNSFEEGGDKSSDSPSEPIKNYLKKTEGFSSGWYLDGSGVPTVGYGFTGKYFQEKYPNGITREQADKEFDRLVNQFSGYVKKYTPNYDSLSQNQKDALLSYMYNVGPGNYTKRVPEFQQALQDKDWNKAAQYMNIGYNDKRNPGLKKRREYEQSLFLSDASPASESLYGKEAEQKQKYWYDQYMNAMMAAPIAPEVGTVRERPEEKLFNSNTPLSDFTFFSGYNYPISQPSKRRTSYVTPEQPVSSIPSNDEIIQNLFSSLNNENLFEFGGDEDIIGPVLKKQPAIDISKSLTTNQVSPQKSTLVVRPFFDTAFADSIDADNTQDGYEFLNTLKAEDALKQQYSNKKYSPLEDNSFTIRKKVYDINHQKEKDELHAILSSKDKGKIKDLQRQLAQDGYYTQSLNGKSKDQIRDIQRRLISKGLLSNERNEDGTYKEADGIVGKKTIAAWNEYNIDGIVGSRTRAALENRVASSGGIQFNKNRTVAEKDKCAKFVRERFEDTVGTGYGVKGNAWNMLKNIEKAGGTMVYNIFNDPSFNNVNTSNVRNLTRTALKNNPLDTSAIKPGDVVGIFNPSTSHYAEVIDKGTTYNSHVGICTGYKNGKPVIEHNIGGKVLSQTADTLQITTVARPNATPYEKMDIPDDLEQKYFVRGQEENDTLNAYSKGLNNASRYMQSIFPDVDEDAIQQIALSVLKRETNYMTNTEKQQKENSLEAKLKYTAKDAYKYLVKRESYDSKSSNLAKFKLSSLSEGERKMLGIESREDLENPQILAKAVTFFLSKNYDYFTRLSKQYPELGLTKDDIVNLTTISYNQGMDKLSTIGFDNGQISPEEIRKIRDMVKTETPIDDFSSTSLSRAGAVGKLIGKFTGYTKSIPYSSSARIEREKNIYSNQDTTK